MISAHLRQPNGKALAAAIAGKETGRQSARPNIKASFTLRCGTKMRASFDQALKIDPDMSRQ
jgi:hypothetical protein